MKKINPKIHHYEIDRYFHRFGSTAQFKNTELYHLIKNLVSHVMPSQKDRFDLRWFCFYLPVKRSGRDICIPMSVIKYKNVFSIFLFEAGYFEVRQGKEVISPFYKKVVKEAMRFLSLIKQTNGKIVRKLVPYDYRVGKIKGRYIMEEIMSQKEKKRILFQYNRHVTKQRGLEKGCSLNEYLNTAAICYRAAYPSKTKEKTLLDMYNRFADGRHGGMLDIKNKNSKKGFMQWYNGSRWIGAHPFEIVFSWHEHGIHLYPPSKHNEWRYGLRVTNYAYAKDFIKMVKALFKHNIPFTASELKQVLDYLTGETYFSVNKYDKLTFNYIPSKEYKEKYFKYIEWEDLEIPRFK